MQNFSIKELTLLGLSLAMITMSTMMIQIPIPATNGYVHVGDAFILVVSVFLGRKYGAIAGGLGSALADILSGFAFWAPFTLVIKALMGYIMGSVQIGQDQSVSDKKSLLTAGLSALVMILGYFIAETIITGRFQVALFSIPWNGMQGVSAIVLYLVIGKIFEKVGVKTLLRP